MSAPHTTVKKSHLTNPCWTSHLKDYVFDLFRSSSSGEVFLWKPAKVPALQCLVHSMNEGVNHLSHVWSEGVKRRLLHPRAFEMTVLVALGTEQPLLGQGEVKKCCYETELWEESFLQLLVVNHQQAASKLEPAQCVGRPPGGIAGDKFWPFCR